MKLRSSSRAASQSSAPSSPPSSSSSGCCQCSEEPTANRTAEPDAEWRAFRAVLVDAIECAIGHACERVIDFPEDVAALEHLLDFAHRRIEGLPCAMRVSDLLQALGILLGAFEAERCAPSLMGNSLHTAARRMRDVAHAAGVPYADPLTDGEDAYEPSEPCAPVPAAARSSHESGIRPDCARRRASRAAHLNAA
jgi:hypothetical protein